MPISEELLQILACPRCKGRLKPVDDDLVCEACRLAWPIVDGIPDFLPDSARVLPEGQEGAEQE